MKTFLKNKIVLIVTFVIILSTNLYADWLNDFNNGITSTVSNPGVYNTQGGTYFSGGGYSMSAPTSSIKLVNARAPSVSAGCSGINIDFGGMEFIKAEKLIDFAKGVIGAAPGYAFNLAMQTLCPQCTDLMNTLTDMANMLNGLDLDSCKTAQMLVDGGFDAIGLTATNNDVGEKKSTFSKGLQDATASVQKAVNAFNDMIKKKCDNNESCPKEFLKGEATFLQMVFSKSPELKKLSRKSSSSDPKDFKSGLINIMRAFIGDIKITMKKNDNATDEEELPQLKLVPSIYGGDNKDNIKKTINIWITGSNEISADSLTYESLSQISTMASLPTLDKATEEVETFGYISLKNLTSIQDAYNERRALSSSELAFLSRFSSPVYKILNTSSIDAHLLNTFIRNFAVLSSSQLAYETISRINKEILTQLVILEAEINSFKLVDKDDIYKKGIQSMRNNIRLLNEYTYSLYEIAYTKFDKSMQDVNQVEQMKTKMQALMARHPVMGGNFFAQGATK